MDSPQQSLRRQFSRERQTLQAGFEQRRYGAALFGRLSHFGKFFRADAGSRYFRIEMNASDLEAAFSGHRQCRFGVDRSRHETGLAQVRR